MKYYKVIYKVGRNNEREYPSGIKGAVWNIAQYHFKDNIMIGGTESRIDADGVEVVELTREEALSQIEEFKNSYPENPEEEMPFFQERKEGPKPSRTGGSKKKRKWI